MSEKECDRKEECELLNDCGFFLNYYQNSEVLKAGWISMFCRDVDKSEACERKKVRKATGAPPPDDMSPTGERVK